MLKRWFIRLGIALAYSLPYVFWGMYGDAACGTMAGYLPLLAGMAALSWISVKTENIPVLLAGNALSFLSSYRLVTLCQIPGWDWYFKPLSSLGFLKAASIAALLGQGFVIYLFYVRKNRAIK